jgi:hypothetical protein
LRDHQAGYGEECETAQRSEPESHRRASDVTISNDVPAEMRLPQRQAEAHPG